jgi:hypothetical protein
VTLKTLAKTGTAVQEVFFVTANPEAVRERLLETPGTSLLSKKRSKKELTKRPPFLVKSLV